MTMTTNSQERLHGLDAVRGLALILGVILHATMSFLPGPDIWMASDIHRSATLALVFFVVHMLRMTTFFLIAGFFAHMGFHRLGAKGFIKDRLKRIALPLVIGWPILFAAIVVAMIIAALVAHGGTLPKSPAPSPAFTASDFPLTHLWFLYVLLIFYALAIAVRSVVALVDRQGGLHAVVDRGVRMLAGFWAPLLLAAPLCASLYFQNDWFMWFGIPTPDHSLYPNLPALVAYGGAFAFGWLLHRQGDLLQQWRHRWWLNLGLAIGFTVASLALVGMQSAPLPAAHNSLTLAYAACYSLGVWFWTFGIIGAALRFLSGHSPARRYLADASYWIYLVHLPLVIALQGLVSQLQLSWMIKFPLILIVAFTLMLLSYQWCVRYSFIGAVLNGRRQPRLASEGSPGKDGKIPAATDTA